MRTLVGSGLAAGRRGQCAVLLSRALHALAETRPCSAMTPPAEGASSATSQQLQRELHSGSGAKAAAAGAAGPAAGFTAPPLNLDTVNEQVKECEYAVRGAIVTRALALDQQLRKAPGSLPFDEIVYCNIGNPQALGQAPVSFFRQVLALFDHPPLIQAAKSAPGLPFSQSAIATAERLLASLPAGASGAYSHSKGIPLCRADVAAGIEARDGGHAADAESIFLTDGASPSAQMVLNLIVRGKQDGVLCPIPQYPLYSATLSVLGGTLVPYYLEEETGWRMIVAELETQVQKAVESGVTPRALVVINPGNPTGQVLDEDVQQEVVRFCVRHRLLLLADEVYQENVYAPGKKFTSFKKVARDMGVGPADLALVSLHSTSKGFYGECGRRGGYMEVTGLDEDVLEQLYKLASVTLCSNVTGQVLASLIMNPPREGDDAFPLFDQERSTILASLARKARFIVDRLNALDGVSCQSSEGAMYAFPRLLLPPAAVQAAADAGVPADALYAGRLLEATGIVVVPGSGFGQKEGTWHLRFTILPPEEKLPAMMDRFADFHNRFMQEFK